MIFRARRDATFMVILLGIGCALGGIRGGYIGQQLCMKYNRSHLPLFMDVTTFLGILPFVGLLNSECPDHHGREIFHFWGGVSLSPFLWSMSDSASSSQSSRNERSRIDVRQFVNYLGKWHWTLLQYPDAGSLQPGSRQTSFTVTLTGFWTITVLPEDQDDMETELARHAAALKRTTTINDEGDGGIETTLLSSNNERHDI
jgi:hypothetical protein